MSSSSNISAKDYQRMRESVVKLLVVEVLKPSMAQTANPALAKLGKKKNHWVFRLVLDKSILYKVNGKAKTCRSVRASVEPGEKNARCDSITLRPMANAYEISQSAFTHFYFDVKGNNFRVQDFVKAADIMLPFAYRTVAQTIVPAKPKDKGKSRERQDRGEVENHLNGCRDFTTQWFIECYRTRLVPWHDQEYRPFHTIIGLRYGERGTHDCPIAEANFARYDRKRECVVECYDENWNVRLSKVALPYREGGTKSVPVYPQYDYEELRRSTAARLEAGSSSRIDFNNVNVRYSDYDRR